MAVALAAAFGLGFTFKSVLSKPAADAPLKRATGIGGVFFKCKDPKLVRDWYKVHLGLNTDKYGTSFEWRQGADSTKKGYTQWSPFNEKTKYFEPAR